MTGLSAAYLKHERNFRRMFSRCLQTGYLYEQCDRHTRNASDSICRLSFARCMNSVSEACDWPHKCYRLALEKHEYQPNAGTAAIVSYLVPLRPKHSGSLRAVRRTDLHRRGMTKTRCQSSRVESAKARRPVILLSGDRGVLCCRWSSRSSTGSVYSGSFRSRNSS